MRTFEVGQRYGEQSVVFEVVKRTAKTITFVPVHHAGKFNETKKEEKKTRICNWGDREVFITGSQTVEA